jgi:acetyltransferase-like isoleucine patch superfamily enzyme
VIEDQIMESDLARLYPGTGFGSGVSIGNEVEIGEGSKIGSGVRIYPGTKIGRNVVVLENTVLGRPTIVPAANQVKRAMATDVAPLAIGDDTVIGCNVVLYRGSILGRSNIICDLTSIREHCELGDDVLLGRSVMVQVNSKIGSRTKIMDSCHLPGDMIVGEDVFLSTHVCGASENSVGRSDMAGRWTGPMLKDRCYIGLNATLLPGIEIGEDAVVAAGSVVTKSVAPRTLVMGVPAKFVRDVSPRDPGT